MSPAPAIAGRLARTPRALPAWCVPDYDLHLFSEGRHWHLYRHLGAHPMRVDGVDGVRFAVWAPNARRVSVAGDFNRWDGRRNVLRHRDSGVWETFVSGVSPGALYRFEVVGAAGELVRKADPFGNEFQLRPETASIVAARSNHEWQDPAWMHARATRDWLHAPMSIYEMHLGSWRRHQDGAFLTYRQLADVLIPYVSELGYTHVEVLPVMEHPYDPSWGYQAIGNFAPTRRYGTPDDFRFFIDRCHQAGIGVVLDWVPAHFPKDGHGLARFDGTPLFEHADPRRSEHPDWGTLIYDYGRPQVKNYLLASALYWLDEFHADGLRVDAVASMLYLDYSRKAGEWLPNRHGGRENLDAVAFLQELNALVPQQHPGALVIAEESTAWPQVSRPTYLGGLGFSMKWDMGWMHDTLEYLQRDPIHRSHHHHRMTFGALYRHTENFVLPLSHDEVVHGKRSLLQKMPGDRWQQFANLRLLHAYQATYPGKKLMFMGGEFAQRAEWDHDAALDWSALQDPLHRGLYLLARDLNRAYVREPALHHFDFEPQGFEWVDCHDSAQSILCFLRKAGGEFVLVALNFTPVPRHGYRLGVPAGGPYEELLNTDSAFYGGSNCGNQGLLQAEESPWMNRPFSLRLTLPPLAAVLLRPKSSISPGA